MKNKHRIEIVFLLIIMAMSTGCKSKENKAATGVVAPQEKSAGPAGEQLAAKSTAPVMSPQDKTDAQTAAARVLAMMEVGDFSSIYKDAAAGFKQIGSESQFVAKFQQTRQHVGVLKNPVETSAKTLPGNGYVFVYRLENEHYKTDMRLTFTRAQSGKMELAGLNQHDELKK